MIMRSVLRAHGLTYKVFEVNFIGLQIEKIRLQTAKCIAK